MVVSVVAFDPGIYCKNSGYRRSKASFPVFLKLEARRLCYHLKAELRWFHSKRRDFALLTCWASEKCWNSKRADIKWNVSPAFLERSLKSLGSTDQESAENVEAGPGKGTGTSGNNTIAEVLNKAADESYSTQHNSGENMEAGPGKTRESPGPRENAIAEVNNLDEVTNESAIKKASDVKEQALGRQIVEEQAQVDEKVLDEQVADRHVAFSSVSTEPSTRLFTTSQFAFLLGVVVAIFGALSVAGVFLQKWWNELKYTMGQESKEEERYRPGAPVSLEAPSAFSFFMKKDVKKKETVEWVNMVIGKLWKVYRRGLESWLVGLLQPLIDNLQKPSYVRRVEIKSFNLGDEPLSVRSVERKTSRNANDLQYHIGLRYTGEARFVLWITLNAGFVPVVIPVGVRGLDLDGEVWVKLRLIPSHPWVGTATWAFVALPKIILALAPFSLFNIMGVPFLSRFLTKLLTLDLPQLFVRPNKIVVDFTNNNQAAASDAETADGINANTNKDFSGELSVTVVDARKLNHFRLGGTDPYVVLTLGDQIVRSKKNSQTTIVGPPGAPIWNQDFQLLVVDPKREKLAVRVRDTVGFTILTVGYGEVDLSTLQDTVPVDKIVQLKSSWGPRRFAGEIMLRLTYKAYVEDEDEDDKPLGLVPVAELEKDSRKEYRAKRRESLLRNFLSALNNVVSDFGYNNIRVKAKPRGRGSFPDEAELKSGKKAKAAEEEGKKTSDMKSPAEPKLVADSEAEKAQDDEGSPKAKEVRAEEVSSKVEEIQADESSSKLQADRSSQASFKAEEVQADESSSVLLKTEGVQPDEGNSASRPRAALVTRRRALQNSAVLWLGLATGVALLAALSLNFSNLVNP